jgi:hypothetical protein
MYMCQEVQAMYGVEAMYGPVLVINLVLKSIIHNLPIDSWF